ncbi:MAG: LexA repressor [Legionellaceae bacterium]
MDKLTDTQQKVYKYICHYISQQGKSPLLSEIARGIGIQSIGSLHKYIQALVEHKYIDIIAHRHRGIRLLDNALLSNQTENHKAIADKAIEAFHGNKIPDLNTIAKSLESVQQHLKKFLQQKPNSSLSTPSSASNTSDYTIPLLGKIAAGKPIEAIANNQNLDLCHMFAGKQTYALFVQGDSMIDEGIFDGDIVICEQSNVAKNDDIVVALIDQENATLKRFKNNYDGTVLLKPENLSMPPMIYQAERVQIQGILLGVIRLHSKR